LAAEAAVFAVDDDDDCLIAEISFELFQPDCETLDRLCDAAFTARIVECRVSIVRVASCAASLSVAVVVVVAVVGDGFVDFAGVGPRRRVDWEAGAMTVYYPLSDASLVFDFQIWTRVS
jgi:hypothetical protein